MYRISQHQSSWRSFREPGEVGEACLSFPSVHRSSLGLMIAARIYCGSKRFEHHAFANAFKVSCDDTYCSNRGFLKRMHPNGTSFRSLLQFGMTILFIVAFIILLCQMLSCIQMTKEVLSELHSGSLRRLLM